MVEQLTAGLMEAFIYGLITAGISGSIFESGDNYVKTASSGNNFVGKIEALPFFLATLVLGFFVKFGKDAMDGLVSGFVYSFAAGQRIGIMLIGGMVAFNYTVTKFNYTDNESIFVMGVGCILILFPDLLYLVV